MYIVGYNFETIKRRTLRTLAQNLSFEIRGIEGE